MGEFYDAYKEMEPFVPSLIRIKAMNSNFQVILEQRNTGLAQPLQVICQHVHGSSLGDVVQMVKNVPSVVMENASIDAAERLRSALADVGAIARIQGGFSDDMIEFVNETIGFLRDLPVYTRFSELKDLLIATTDQAVDPSDVLALIELKFENEIKAELCRLEEKLTRQ